MLFVEDLQVILDGSTNALPHLRHRVSNLESNGRKEPPSMAA